MARCSKLGDQLIETIVADLALRTHDARCCLTPIRRLNAAKYPGALQVPRRRTLLVRLPLMVQGATRQVVPLQRSTSAPTSGFPRTSLIVAGTAKDGGRATGLLRRSRIPLPLRIPMISYADSEASRTPVPIDADRSFQSKPIA